MFRRVYNPEDSNNVRLSGKYKAVLYNDSEGIKQVVEGPNIVCTNGKEFLASFLNSAATAAATFTMRYLAIGSDNTGELVANTALGTELARHTGTVSYVSGCVYQVIATFTTGVGTGDVYEYGLFSSSTNGTMLSRDVEGLITKGANDQLTVTYQLTIS